MVRLAINGFGRIGRTAFKIALEKPDIEVVAVNDLTDAKTLAHLLKYDSVYGIYEKRVSAEEQHIIVDGKKFQVLSEKDPSTLPWGKLGIDIVIESTGAFTTQEKAKAHIAAGAKRVIISAPAKDDVTPIILLGVNAEEDAGDIVISNASCTTNCISPVIKVLHETFGVEKALMTTVHAYTADQNLQDGPHRDLRRARAAAFNIVPTTTGAAKATTKTIPELEGRFDGIAIRVPVIVGSISDITAVLKKDVTVDGVNDVFRKASQNPIYHGILDVTDEPWVSSDVIGNPYSAVIDLPLTQVVGGNLAKVFAWYDNEWGYSMRLVELVIEAAKKLR